MSVPIGIEKYLRDHKIHYTCYHHLWTQSALANTSHIRCDGHHMQKAIILFIEQEPSLFILPSNEKIHFQSIKDHLKVKHIRLLTEDELKQVFPDCELGAHTIFGGLYNIPVYLSEHCLDNYSVYTNGGKHTDIIQLPLSELISIERPYIFNFSYPYKTFEKDKLNYFYNQF